MALIEVKLRPTGPWRAGHRTGDRERVDVIYHSDALYSAITHAMRVLGWLDAWLEATARATSPAVRFSSLFPFSGKTRLITPPKSYGIPLVPLELARGGAFDKSRYQADIPSGCLLPQGSSAPFQVSVRSAAAVDRVTGAINEPHRIACLEFAGNAGWWGVFETSDDEWESRVKSAFRLLADSGFGGERSRGWGRSSEPVFSTATALFPDRAPNGTWWLLGVFSPAEEDQIDWSKSTHTIAVRGGWTDSPSGSGPKKHVRMVDEGSVLASPLSLAGRSVDVAPDGFPHPVYRNGQALAVPVPTPKPELEPIRETASEPELPAVSEATESEPQTTEQTDPEPGPATPKLEETPEPEPEPIPERVSDPEPKPSLAKATEPEPETTEHPDPEPKPEVPEIQETPEPEPEIKTPDPDPAPEAAPAAPEEPPPAPEVPEQ